MRYHLPLFTVLALSTGAVFAHAELMSSTPENRETVTTVPNQIELVFSERLEVAFSTFKIYALPENLAQAEADTALRENTMPLGDTSDDDQPADDHGGDHGDDHAENAGDDHGHDSTDDTGDDQSDAQDDDHGDDHSDDHAQGELSAFVAEMLEAENDEHEGRDVTTQGSQVSIALADDLEPGWYVVMWRALSADEHPVEGYVTFNYQP